VPGRHPPLHASMHSLYDITPPLLALGAEIDIASADGSRTVDLAELLRETGHGLGVTALIRRVRVPVPPPGSGWAYEKLKVTEGSYASANCAALAATDGKGNIASLSLAVGAVEDRPCVVTDAVADVIGGPWTAQSADHVETAVRRAIQTPLSDQRGHGDYRRAMAGVLARRALERAVNGSGGSSV
ncbi:MAG: FAD binding domain-containing protein, partial [Pseudomonadota bacterium]